MRRQYIEVPLQMSCSIFFRLWTRLKGMLLSPFYLVLAKIKSAPGIRFHMRCVGLGTRLLLSGHISLKTIFGYLFSPMDSTRYFEFHEVWKILKGYSFKDYMDVSSPRLLPLLLIDSLPKVTAQLINPDSNDLRETEKLANALGLRAHCMFSNDILENVSFAPESFDLITCISVLEHLPEDKAAVKKMWSLLRPGGKLILTLPCMSKSMEQYISYNQYGVLNAGEDGYTFWQNYYDNERLEACIYSITGIPAYISVYGEKTRGLFFRNSSMKRLLGPYYPFWREPYMMASEYRYFPTIDELPGEGVVVLEFVKS